MKKHEIDMTTGSIFKKLLQFAIPLVLNNALSILFHSADTVIVGRFAGSDSMAAVGSNGALVSLLTQLFSGIAIGSNVLCAQYFGSREDDKLSACTHTSLIIGGVLGLIVCIAGYAFSTPMLQAMNTDAAVLPLASIYLRIFFIGTPASMLYNFAASVLRALGDTDRPMKNTALPTGFM